MIIPSLSSETLHASCVTKNGTGILISGRSGAGKSDLALRLIDRGAVLVSDDYTVVRRVEGKLLASPPVNTAGKIEVRGLGIMSFEHKADIPVALMVDLSREIERMPDRTEAISIAGIKIPVIALDSFAASAPMKVELALSQVGLALK